jgi:hypothetical protein
VKCHASENEGMCVLFILRVTEPVKASLNIVEHDSVRKIIVLNVYSAQVSRVASNKIDASSLL